MSKLRGAFFNNFFNVAMGLSLLPLVDQFFEPVHTGLIVKKTIEIVEPTRAGPKGDAEEDRKLQDCVRFSELWKHSGDVIAQGLSSSVGGDRINEYIKSIRAEFRPAIGSNPQAVFDGLEKALRNAVAEHFLIDRCLLVAIFLFVIKYIHEADRIETLILNHNHIPWHYEFWFFFGRVLCLIFVILLARLASWDIPWYIPLFIWGSFVVQDLAFSGLLWKKHINILPHELKRRYVRTSVRWTWVVLDILLVGVWLEAWTLGNGVVGHSLLLFALVLQLGPYFPLFYFYFGDFEAPDTRICRLSDELEKDAKNLLDGEVSKNNQGSEIDSKKVIERVTDTLPARLNELISEPKRALPNLKELIKKQLEIRMPTVVSSSITPSSGAATKLNESELMEKLSKALVDSVKQVVG